MYYIVQVIVFSVIIFLSLFVFSKLLNTAQVFTYMIFVAGVVFSCVLGYAIFSLGEIIPTARFVLMVLFIAIFAGKVTGIKASVALATALLSVGISYGVYLTATVLSFLLFYPLVGYENRTLPVIFSSIISGTTLFFFFRIRRFRKGFPFLHNKWSGTVGVAVSGVLICILVLINQGFPPDAETAFFLLAGVILCIAVIVFWCRKEIFKLYMQRIRKREQQEDDAQIKAILAEKESMSKRIGNENEELRVMEEILKPFIKADIDARFVYERIMFLLQERESLVNHSNVNHDAGEIQASNDLMAKIIHRDAKLLRAMQEAVSTIKENNSDMRDSYNRIGLLIWEREDEISFPSTNNPLIDGILKHMRVKAAQEGIKMDVEIKCDLSEFNDLEISFIDFETVIVEVLENAIIATKICEYKRIQIAFGKNESFFVITVYDSGIPFKSETLENLGKIPTSTHFHEGGSGIGYISIFSIMSKYNASLLIHEFLPEQDKFTKAVTFRMDGKNSFIILSDI